MKRNRGTHHRTAVNLLARRYSSRFHLCSAFVRVIQFVVHEKFAHGAAPQLIRVQFRARVRLTPSQR
jgi:hypothetical protein